VGVTRCTTPHGFLGEQLMASPTPIPTPRTTSTDVESRGDTTAAIGQVGTTFPAHRAFFASRMTLGKVARCPRSLDVMQTAALKEDANVETGTRIMSATTRLVWHAHAGPGARAARLHTASALPRPSSHQNHPLYLLLEKLHFGAFGAVTATLTSPRKHFTRQVESLGGPRIN
jgi:hypothetical protein